MGGEQSPRSRYKRKVGYTLMSNQEEVHCMALFRIYRPEQSYLGCTLNWRDPKSRKVNIY